MGSRVAHTSEKHERMSLLCMIVTSSQSGDLVAVTRIITRVHLVTWVECSRSVCGDMEAAGT